jgi:hypothetical protein
MAYIGSVIRITFGDGSCHSAVVFNRHSLYITLDMSDRRACLRREWGPLKRPKKFTNSSVIMDGLGEQFGGLPCAPVGAAWQEGGGQCS